MTKYYDCMPAGKYYIGDLCYVIADMYWNEVCTKTFDYRGRMIEGKHKLDNGIVFADFGTLYGDGCYFDQNGHEYSVDSGTIGCILFDNISNTEYSDRILELGNVVDFEHDFVVKSDGSVITFGKIEIDTDPEEPDPEYDDE